MGSIPLRITLDELDEFIKVYDGIKYLLLFPVGFYDRIYDRSKYLLSKKVVWQIVLIITFAKSEFIHIVIYL